jgi:hypothetical protein
MGLRPTDFRTRYGFRRPIPREIAPEKFGVWTIPSPWPCGFRCCPSSLYTFPFPGLARDCHLTGSPEFGQFCSFGFPEGTQVAQVPCVYQFRHARVPIPCIAGESRRAKNCRKRQKLSHKWAIYTVWQVIGLSDSPGPSLPPGVTSSLAFGGLGGSKIFSQSISGTESPIAASKARSAAWQG